MVKIPTFQCRGLGFNPDQGTKTPHATQHSQKKKNLQKLSCYFYESLTPGLDSTRVGLYSRFDMKLHGVKVSGSF